MKIELETDEKEITISVGDKKELLPDIPISLQDGIDEKISFNETTSKWCLESECIYETKVEAIKAYTDSFDRSEIKIYHTDIAKSFDEEKRLFKAVILRPNQFDNDGVDEDYYSEEIVEKACHDFNEYCQQGNLGHVVNTDLLKFVESYISDADYTLGDGEVKKGDWIGVLKVYDDGIWESCKSGTFTGFSIGCSALVEVLEDE